MSIPHKKTAIVTGASRGIGAAAAELLAESGCGVVVNYLHSERRAHELCGMLTRRGLSCAPFRADVSVRDEAFALAAFALDEFGGADILVNNAGTAQQKLFTDITPDEWDGMFAVSAGAAFHCTQAVLPYMLHRKSGCIVNVSSIWGITGASCEVHYSAAKAALIGMTKALAKELGPSGIRVNCVAPGAADTDMNSGLSGGDIRLLCEDIPLGRLGTAREIAQCIRFLCSDGAAYVTGQVLSPNGGIVI